MAEIVVGVDGSEHAARALRWAVQESEVRNAETTAVLAWGLFDEHHKILGARFDAEVGGRQALAALDSYIREAIGAQAAQRVRRRAVCEGTAAGLLAVASDAELVVVGARGLGGFKGLLLGSVSQQCLHHARLPVAVIRGEERPPLNPQPGRIVAGVDGSEASRRAVRWAADEARRRSAHLEVVHAWRVPWAVGYPYSTAVFEHEEFEEAGRQVLDQEIAELDATGVPGEIRPVLQRGAPASVILEHAAGADLLVLGTRGLGGLTGLLLGSVSHQVAHHAPCPLVVVPGVGGDQSR